MTSEFLLRLCWFLIILASDNALYESVFVEIIQPQIDVFLANEQANKGEIHNHSVGMRRNKALVPG